MENSSTAVLSQLNNPANRTPKRCARRRLFGRPDPSTDQWLVDQLNEISEMKMRKWGLDPAAETPCASSLNSPYVVTAVPAETVPHFYRPTFRPSSGCSSSEIENRQPVSTSDESSTSASPESRVSRSAVRSSAEKQTKIIAFMKVDSRKRLRQTPTKKKADTGAAGVPSTGGPSPSKAPRLSHHVETV